MTNLRSFTVVERVANSQKKGWWQGLAEGFVMGSVMDLVEILLTGLDKLLGVLFKTALCLVALIAFGAAALWALPIIFYHNYPMDSSNSNEIFWLWDIKEFLGTQVHYFMFAIFYFLIGSIAAILYVLLDIKDSLKRGD
jgi:hypothetical protein